MQRKHSNHGRPRFTATQRALIYDRHGGICVRCLTAIAPNAPYDIDHLTPISSGGGNEWYNLGPAHPSCNRRHGARMRSLPRARVWESSGGVSVSGVSVSGVVAPRARVVGGGVGRPVSLSGGLGTPPPLRGITESRD